MLEDLPVETIEYHLPEGKQNYSQCGEPLHEMSKEIRRELKDNPCTGKSSRACTVCIFLS